jgi:hypothetical protein
VSASPISEHVSKNYQICYMDARVVGRQGADLVQCCVRTVVLRIRSEGSRSHAPIADDLTATVVRWSENHRSFTSSTQGDVPRSPPPTSVTPPWLLPSEDRASVASGQDWAVVDTTRRRQGGSITARASADEVRFLQRFTRGHVRQLDTMLARAQRNAYLAAGVSDVTLDVDSTDVFSRSRRRQGLDRTWKESYALHPMLCSDAETGAAVHARLRRGRAGASTGISTFVREALRAVPDGVAVRARFYSGALLAQLEATGVTYLCGVPLAPPVVRAATELDDEYWSPCRDRKGEVAEFGYRLGDGGPFRRHVVKRIANPPGRQASLWDGGHRS